MVTFWQRAAPVNSMFSLLCPFMPWLFPFLFPGQDLGSVCVSSWSLLTFYLFVNNHVQMAREFHDLNIDFVV